MSLSFRKLTFFSFFRDDRHLVRISVRETDESQKMTCTLAFKLKVNKSDEIINTEKLTIYEVRKVGRDYLLRSPC